MDIRRYKDLKIIIHMYYLFFDLRVVLYDCNNFSV